MSKAAANSYSASIAAAATGTSQRGSVHSVFAAAANIVFPTSFPGQPQGSPLPYPSEVVTGRPQGSPLLSEFVLSLNALDAPRVPNGLRLSVPGGAFPFAALRPGMPVLFGAQRLHIEAIECSLDLTMCTRWDPHIYQPDMLDRRVLQENWERLATIQEKHNEETGFRRGEGGADMGRFLEHGVQVEPGAGYGRMGGPLRVALHSLSGIMRGWGTKIVSVPRTATRKGPPPASHPPLSLHTPSSVSKKPSRVSEGGAPSTLAPTDITGIHALALCLCGRGVGLTPAGDDILAGWMAVGWLLYGSDPDFLEACRQIVEVARQQTHLLSQCWLAYAARGDVALPIVSLLETLALPRTGENDTRLEQAAQAVLAMGATSGSDVIAGILLGLEMSR